MIHFVGPLPPPVHGFSFINAAMLRRFQALGSVAVFDRAPVGGSAINRFLCAAKLFWRFIFSLQRAPASSGLYIALSGGLGQLKDLPYVLAARALGLPVLVHHHSFAYLRTRPWHARWLMAALRHARHIALCDCMADSLVAGYGLLRGQVSVVSNAAFLPAAQALDERIPVASLRLGFLSNITPEKGIWTYFELADALQASGLAVQALVAGPVAPDIADRFARELQRRPWCRHLGAVYGAEKRDFFGRIDVLVFPTFYANEAEPVTILEALAAGVPVVANARGCIPDLLPRAAGVVFHDDAQFVHLAGNQLQAWVSEDQARWQDRRRSAQDAFSTLRDEHLQRLDAIVHSLMHRPATAA